MDSIVISEGECTMQDKNSWSRSVFIVMLVMVILIGAGCGTMYVNERTESTGSVKETSVEAEIATMETVFDDFSIQIENIEDLLDDKIIGVVYFGRDTCPFCLTLNGILKAELDSIENIRIYKFDTDTWREDERFQEVLDKYTITSIPALIRINSDLSIEMFVPNEKASNELAVQALEKFLAN